MILLGVNCGFGNHDVATLPESALDLDGGWIDFPRPKTGIERRCRLWDETVQALRDAMASRPEPNEDAKGLVFVDDSPRRKGQPFFNARIDKAEAVTAVVGKLLRDTKVHRPGLGFYTLRHVFQTIGERCRDAMAVKTVMGHADHSMSDHYREGIEDDRLQAVADVIHTWLYEDEEGGAA